MSEPKSNLLSKLISNPVLLLGCGKMGGAMLSGWLEDGLSPSNVTLIEPNAQSVQSFIDLGCKCVPASDELGLSEKPQVAILALKPQVMGSALPSLKPYLADDTLVITVAAGLGLEFYQDILGESQPIIRVMPNTPAAIGQGIAGGFANQEVSDAQKDLCHAMLLATGELVWLETEAQMHAVTAVSGSGPAYVFHMIEALTQAALSQGLPEAMAARLALKTVQGAGALAANSTQTPGQLRVNVTSPNGTTQAGLEVLMQNPNGLSDLMDKTVKAAHRRSVELAAT